MSTKYGKKVVLTLEDDRKYFLPPRYCAIVRKMAKSPEEIDCTGLYMTYMGRMKNSLKSPILKFIKEDDESSSSSDDIDFEEEEIHEVDNLGNVKE